MAVLPYRSQAITPDWLQVGQGGLLARQALPTLEHSRLSAFTRTPRAGTGPAQRLPVMQALMLITPG
nr:hypothetical protein [Ktedonobacter sp. SOSP1-52]